MAVRRPGAGTRKKRALEAVASIGRTIRTLRQQRGWTLEQASETAEVDARHLQRIETGAVSSSATTLLRIADALGVAVGDLFAAVSSPEAEGTSVRQPEDGAPASAAPDIDGVPARVGRSVASWRHERGWTQAELAARAGLTEQYTQRVESGRQNPSIKVLAQLASALRVTLSELVHEEAREEQSGRAPPTTTERAPLSPAAAKKGPSRKGVV